MYKEVCQSLSKFLLAVSEPGSGSTGLIADTNSVG